MAVRGKEVVKTKMGQSLNKLSCTLKHFFVFESVLLQRLLPCVGGSWWCGRKTQLLRCPRRRSDRGPRLRHDTPSPGKRGEILATFPQSFSCLSCCPTLFIVPYLSALSQLFSVFLFYFPMELLFISSQPQMTFNPWQSCLLKHFMTKWSWRQQRDLVSSECVL